MDRCDFCSEVKVVAELPAESFSLPEFRYTSRGSWAACAVCEELVRAGDRDALLVRSVITFIAKEELDEFTLGGATAAIKTLHDGFFKHWGGEILLLHNVTV